MPRLPDHARRAALARAALDALRTRGVQTSMRELADVLGVKRPTLYFYFADLRAVLAAGLGVLADELAAAVAARVAGAAHPIDRLRAVIDAALAFHRELRALGEPELRAVLERDHRLLTGAERDALIGDLRAGIARREVRPCDPERVVDLVLSWLDGAVLPHALGSARTADAGEELARRLLDPLRRSRRRRRARG